MGIVPKGPQGHLAACCQYCNTASLPRALSQRARKGPISSLLPILPQNCPNMVAAWLRQPWRRVGSESLAAFGIKYPAIPEPFTAGVSGAPYKACSRQASGANAPPTLAQLCRLALFLFCVSRNPRRLHRRPVRLPALQKIWGPKMRRARLAGRRFAAICAATKREEKAVWISIWCVIPVNGSLPVHYVRTKLVRKVPWITIC